MKKLISTCLGLLLFTFLWGLWGHLAPVSAQSKGGPELAQRQPYLIFAGKSDLSLTYSQAYTLYLPLIRVPPPPNPKKGVGVTTGPACSDLQLLRGSWYMNWQVAPDPTCTPTDAAKFVPRITSASHMNYLVQAVKNAEASGWLLGFSEPNLPWQTNISPLDGAIYWKQIEDAALPDGIKLVSPSPNQYEPGQADPYGHQWTWEMVRQFEFLYGRKPHFDAMGWNIYESDPAEIKQFLNDRRNEALARGYDVPVWVLEYAGECWHSSNNNTVVMKEVTAWFNQTFWIQRYAWFANRISGNENNFPGWQSCSLINPNTGTLTSLGQLYTIY